MREKRKRASNANEISIVLRMRATFFFRATATYRNAYVRMVQIFSLANYLYVRDISVRKKQTCVLIMTFFVFGGS